MSKIKFQTGSMSKMELVSCFVHELSLLTDKGFKEKFGDNQGINIIEMEIEIYTPNAKIIISKSKEATHGK